MDSPHRSSALVEPCSTLASPAKYSAVPRGVARRIAYPRSTEDTAEEHQNQQRSSRKCLWNAVRSSRKESVQQRSSAHCTQRTSRGCQSAVMRNRKWPQGTVVAPSPSACCLLFLSFSSRMPTCSLRFMVTHPSQGPRFFSAIC